MEKKENMSSSIESSEKLTPLNEVIDNIWKK